MDWESLTSKVQEARLVANVARNRPELTPAQRQELFALYSDLDDLEGDLELETIQATIDTLKGHSNVLAQICQKMKASGQSLTSIEGFIQNVASTLDGLISALQTLLAKG